MDCAPWVPSPLYPNEPSARAELGPYSPFFFPLRQQEVAESPPSHLPLPRKILPPNHTVTSLLTPGGLVSTPNVEHNRHSKKIGAANAASHSSPLPHRYADPHPDQGPNRVRVITPLLTISTLSSESRRVADKSTFPHRRAQCRCRSFSVGAVLRP
jgi:hypothetical protein